MVPRFPLLRIGIELEHREIDHPQGAPALLGEAAVVAHLVAQRAHVSIDCCSFAGAEEDDVAVRGVRAGQNGLQRLRMEVLHDRRLQAFGPFRALVDLDPRQALGAERLGKFAIAVELAAR